MIDHLINFPDEATAQADPIVGKYYTPASDDGPGGWRGDICFVVRVYKVTGSEQITDPETGQTYSQDTREFYPGWCIWIALAALDETLRDLPNNACRIIADYAEWQASNPEFIRYLAPDFDQSTLSDWHIEPAPAREVQYPFGSITAP